MKASILGIIASMVGAELVLFSVAMADEPAKSASKPADARQAKFEAAVASLTSTNAGVHAGAIVSLEEVGADAAASKALRGDAWQKAADALEADKTKAPALLAAYRQALETGLDATQTARFKMRMAVVLLAVKDVHGAKEAMDSLAPEFDRLPREVQDDVAPAMASVLAANGDLAGAIRWTLVFLDKGLAANDSDEIAQRLKLADLLVASGKADEGMAVVNKLMDRIGGMVTPDAASVLQWMVQRQTDAGNFKAATDTCRKVLAARSAAPLGEQMNLRNRLASILIAAKDEAGAEQECRIVLAAWRAAPPESRIYMGMQALQMPP